MNALHRPEFSITEQMREHMPVFNATRLMELMTETFTQSLFTHAVPGQDRSVSKQALNAKICARLGVDANHFERQRAPSLALVAQSVGESAHLWSAVLSRVADELGLSVMHSPLPAELACALQLVVLNVNVPLSMESLFQEKRPSQDTGQFGQATHGDLASSLASARQAKGGVSDGEGEEKGPVSTHESAASVHRLIDWVREQIAHARQAAGVVLILEGLDELEESQALALAQLGTPGAFDDLGVSVCTVATSHVPRGSFQAMECRLLTQQKVLSNFRSFGLESSLSLSTQGVGSSGWSSPEGESAATATAHRSMEQPLAESTRWPAPVQTQRPTVSWGPQGLQDGGEPARFLHVPPAPIKEVFEWETISRKMRLSAEQLRWHAQGHPSQGPSLQVAPVQRATFGRKRG